MRRGSSSPAGKEIAERVKSILDTRKINLHWVSQRSETIFGHGSARLLPHNLYYELERGFSPSLYQIYSLSKSSDYRMNDWLHIFGFDLEDIPRLQVLLPTKRTILLDSTVTDVNAWVPWFRNRRGTTADAPVVPLTKLLQAGPAVRQASLLELGKQQALYVKIGREDDFSFPDLLPGSIVRIDLVHADDLLRNKKHPSDRIFLVEHAGGFCCCRVLSENRKIRIVSTQLPFANVELELGRETRIIGVADLEIRPQSGFDRPLVPRELERRWRPGVLRTENRNLSKLLQLAREKMALSLREAAGLSRQIASLLNDERYFISASSLSDYEAREDSPRHFQKAISLCLLYNVPFVTFLEFAGLPPNEAGKDPIPDEFIPRSFRSDQNEIDISLEEEDRTGFLAHLIREWGDIPVLLKGAISEVSGMKAPSLGSFFWVGGIRTPLHPHLENALIVSVDRRKKRPVEPRSQSFWEQSLYIVLKRDGSYLCGPCAVENGTIVMHPHPDRLDLRQEFRNRQDAEVVGQICAIARRL